MLGGAKGTMVLISCVMFRPGIPSVDTGRTIPISFNDHIHTVTVLAFLYFFSKIFPKVQSARWKADRPQTFRIKLSNSQPLSGSDILRSF